MRINGYYNLQSTITIARYICNNLKGVNELSLVKLLSEMIHRVNSQSADQSQVGLARKQKFSAARSLHQTLPTYLNAVLTEAKSKCSNTSPDGYHCLVQSFSDSEDGTVLDREFTSAFIAVFGEIKYKLDEDELDKLHSQILSRCLDVSLSTATKNKFIFVVYFSKNDTPNVNTHHILFTN